MRLCIVLPILKMANDLLQVYTYSAHTHTHIDTHIHTCRLAYSEMYPLTYFTQLIHLLRTHIIGGADNAIIIWTSNCEVYTRVHTLIYSCTHTLIYSYTYTHILIYSYTHTLTHSYTQILKYRAFSSTNIQTPFNAWHIIL